MKELTAPRRQPRPVYYTRDQLDQLREKIIVSFCRERYGQELNPIPTAPTVARRMHPRGAHRERPGVAAGIVFRLPRPAVNRPPLGHCFASHKGGYER